MIVEQGVVDMLVDFVELEVEAAAVEVEFELVAVAEDMLDRMVVAGSSSAVVVVVEEVAVVVVDHCNTEVAVEVVVAENTHCKEGGASCVCYLS